jgi:hypothetical protein
MLMAAECMGVYASVALLAGDVLGINRGGEERGEQGGSSEELLRVLAP